MTALNGLDYAVLFGSVLGIAAYGVVRTRGRRDLHGYLRGKDSSWLVIGLSVMATQASAITFLSTPGQGYENGLGFVQNYFAMPLALIIIAAFFLPMYRRLNVYTAYEFLGKRFDAKTRLLAAGLFLVQRGLGAGITIYAPAIVLSSVFGWSLDLTIVASGVVVILYTVAGGSDAVTHTQKYQIGVIFVGMIAAFVVLLCKLPPDLRVHDALVLAGHFGKMEAVSFSPDPNQRYTFWTGMLGGMFLMLSYFGTDQSQVQRYISGDQLRESRLGLMFNALFKIPMQFLILLLGIMLFVFYQFNAAPVFFNKAAWAANEMEMRSAEGTGVPAGTTDGHLREFETRQVRKQGLVREWLAARHRGDGAGETELLGQLQREYAAGQEERRALTALFKKVSPEKNTGNDADYVFITFILEHLPHGLIGLLVASFFAATLSSKAAELNALASTTTIDFYRHVIRPAAPDAHYVFASRGFTVLWGATAIGFAIFARVSENLIQAVNIVGSIFYGVVLGLFLVAFFLKRVQGHAAFIGAVVAQLLVFVLYASLPISYLWYNLIGCGACVFISVLVQGTVALSSGRNRHG